MRLLPIALTAVWVALDQWLKIYTVANVPPYPQTIDVLPGFMALSYTTNIGAAWSLFSGGAPVLMALRAFVGLAIIVYLWRGPRVDRLQSIALALIAAGGIGNAIDGFTRGYVVDMLLSHTLSAVYRPFFGTIYPIFNLADSGVFIGVLLLIASNLFAPRRDGRIRV